MTPFPSGSNMRALIKAQDWELEAVDQQGLWSPVFRTMISLCLNTPMPTAMYWGSDFRLFYGDQWARVLGDRHPWALGKPARDVWPKLWDRLSVQFEQVYATGQSIEVNNHLQGTWHNGALKEPWEHYSLSPIHDEHGDVKGLFNQSLSTNLIVLADEQHRGRQDRQKLALHAIGGIGTWEWDLATDRITTNEQFASFYSIDPLAAAAGAPLTDFTAAVHPDDRLRLHTLISDICVTGGHLDIDYRVIKDKSDFWISIRGNGLRDASGVLTHVLGIGIDITARKQAESLIEARNAHQAFLFEMDAALREADSVQATYERTCGALGLALGASQVSYADIDASGEFATFLWEWNDGSIPTNIGRHRITDFGVSFADDLHRGQTIIVDDVAFDTRTSSPDAQAMFAQVSVCAFINIPLIKEGRLVAVLAVHHAKPRIWLEDDVFLAREVAGRVWTTMVRERAQEALRASEMRFQAIINSIDQMIWSSRKDGGYDFFNQRWYDFTGMSAGTANNEPWTGLLHHEDRKAADLAWQQCLVTGQPYHHEFRLRHQSGAYKWVLGRAHPVRDTEGAIIRWYGTSTEIDEIVEAREVLVRSKLELEALVKERTTELMAVEGKLRQSQKMEAIGQLTGGIAHDFNNMLTIVISSLELLSDYLAATDARADRYINSAQAGARRAAMLTRQLLAFSRKQSLAPELVQINNLVAWMSELLGRTLGSDIQLETILEVGLEHAFVDPNQLENAILNLAVNARDAMAEGGKLTIETKSVFFDDQSVHDNLEMPAGPYVMIAVTDTGTGMPTDVLAKAFDPFFTTKGIGLGTGLGLSQVYGFVQQTGGSVKIFSEPGEGTTVKIYLPQHLAEISEPSAIVRLVLGESTQ